jgi:antitoxin CptB
MKDVDILGWALGSLSVPTEYQGTMMNRMRRLDYVDIPR